MIEFSTSMAVDLIASATYVNRSGEAELFVCCADKNDTQFITWQVSQHDGSCFWGHYFRAESQNGDWETVDVAEGADVRRQALEDLARRANLIPKEEL